MRTKFALLTLYFIAFYEFQEITWTINRILLRQPGFNFFSSKRHTIAELTAILTWVIAAMLAYQIFFYFFHKRNSKAMAIFCYLLIGLPMMIVTRYFIEEVIVYEIWGFHNYGRISRQPVNYILDNFHFAIYYSSFGIVFFFIQLANVNRRRQDELELQTRGAELSFLKSQINPHFLFNSLNNVYTLVYQKSAHALPAISKLSELLRYMLYEKEDLVPLSKELEYLKNYISLQFLRYDFKPSTDIQLQFTGIDAIKIAPLTLIPFVENAFKHGDLKDINQPLIIKLNTTDKELIFIVSNKKGTFNKDPMGGIGLYNVKKRLELLYGS
ncbi:MAG: histidine kinase, partial [Pedobacter sp.]